MRTHTQYLDQALELAKIRRGFCAPNPSVGALLVKNHEIIATGYHWASGHPHAEAQALAKLPPELTQDAALYVTLEPCCHPNKKTPPCAQELIKRGIREVYYGFKDPNPAVSGLGERHLRDAGVLCQHIPFSAIDDFYQSYQHWWQTKQPWVTAKIAISLDGKIAGEEGKPIQITGPELQQYTHEWRKRSDAILTTAKTIIQDNPRFDVRLPDEYHQKPLYILDRQLALPLEATVFATTAKICLFHEAHASPERLQALQTKGVSCFPIPKTEQGLDLNAVLDKIGADGIHDVWVEAGGKCFNSFVRSKLANRAFLYVGTKFLGPNTVALVNDKIDLFSHAKLKEWSAKGNDTIYEFTF